MTTETENTLTAVLDGTATLLVMDPKGQDLDMKTGRLPRFDQRLLHLQWALEQKKQFEHRDTALTLPALRAAHRTGARRVHEDDDVGIARQKIQTRLSRPSENPGASPNISQMKKPLARRGTRNDARHMKRPRNQVESREYLRSYFPRATNKVYEL